MREVQPEGIFFKTEPERTDETPLSSLCVVGKNSEMLVQVRDCTTGCTPIWIRIPGR